MRSPGFPWYDNARHPKAEGWQMKTKEAQKTFEALLAKKQIELDQSVPGQGLLALTDFYRSQRADDVELAIDGDMLLFQWGTHDWGDGDHFELDLTRQLTLAEADDEDMWQLSLTYLFAASDELNALGMQEKWCFHPDELDDLVLLIQTSAPFGLLKDTRAAKVRLSFGNVG